MKEFFFSNGNGLNIFTKNELLHKYFSRISDHRLNLTALQNNYF